MSTSTITASFLSTRRGRLTLALLCLVGFLDSADGSIVNIALPTIRDELHFTNQTLQWVASAYVLTYGGFLMLGGRLGDLLGRRRLLLVGTVVFGLASMMCGLAQTSGVLVAGRLIQGLGAAFMTPAGLSLLTTSFDHGTDRLRALGAWGSVAGLGSLLAIVLGGLLTAGPGWPWVFFVNPLLCVVITVAAYRLLPDDRRRAEVSRFDLPGAVLITGAMSALIYGLVRAPSVGWGNPETVLSLTGAVALFVGFVVNERRQQHPLVPFRIFRIKGLAAADATQVIAIAGFGAMFFFLTLYMQTVLDFGVIQAGLAYLPAGLALAVTATLCSKLFARTGTRPLIVAGALVAAVGIYWFTHIPVDGSYLSDLLPGLIAVGIGLGAVGVGVTTAGNAGVPPQLAGLAAALITTSFQLGNALGLAVFSAFATARTATLLSAGATPADALTGGFRRALLASSIALVGAAIIATRATDTKGEPVMDAGDPTLAEVDPLATGEPLCTGDVHANACAKA